MYEHTSKPPQNKGLQTDCSLIRLKQVNPSPESEAGVAYLKITAVYGEFDSFEDLEKQTKVTSHLGKTETIKSEWVNTISTLIIILAAISGKALKGGTLVKKTCREW
jgi:hypothetical protein